MKKYSLIVAVASAILLTGCFHKSNDAKSSTEQKPSFNNEQAVGNGQTANNMDKNFFQDIRFRIRFTNAPINPPNKNGIPSFSAELSNEWIDFMINCSTISYNDVFGFIYNYFENKLNFMICWIKGQRKPHFI